MKYAVIEYSGGNLGDDLQSIAVERLLPRVDEKIDRDHLQHAKAWKSDTILVLSGWFGPGIGLWPPSGSYKRAYVGFHADNADIVRHLGLPIGCRDKHTMALCRKHKKEHWLSWCTTLSLERPRVKRTNETIVAGPVDWPLPHRKIDPVNDEHAKWNQDQRRRAALELLKVYASAGLVVTNKLHAMLPCIAFGTPVVQIATKFKPHRFKGYEDLAWTPLDYDPDRPRTPPERAVEMSRALVERLRSL